MASDEQWQHVAVAEPCSGHEGVAYGFTSGLFDGYSSFVSLYSILLIRNPKEYRQYSQFRLLHGSES